METILSMVRCLPMLEIHLELYGQWKFASQTKTIWNTYGMGFYVGKMAMVANIGLGIA